MSHILKHKAYFLVFLISLIINLFSLDYKQLPITYPDSEGYISVTQQINQGKWPNFSSRTPTYPLYLSLFAGPNKLSCSVFCSTIIGAIGSMFLLWIIKLFISNQLLASALTIFTMSDFGIISFQSTILTESIAPTLMLFSLFANLILIKNKKTTLLNFTVIGIADFLFIFIKPIFFILPLLLKLIYLSATFFFPKIIHKEKRRAIIVSCLINIIFMTTFLGYNYNHVGKIQISSVKTFTTLGKMISYGYLDSIQQYPDAPTNVLKVIEVYNKKGQGQSSASNLLNLIQEEKILNNQTSPTSLLTEVNNYILSKNKTNFLFNIITLIPSNFNTRSLPHSEVNDHVAYHFIFKPLNFLHTTLNSSKLYGFILGFCIWTYFLIKQKQKAIYLGTILFFVLFTICVISVFARGSFARIRQPIDPLLNLLLFSPLIYIKSKKRF